MKTITRGLIKLNNSKTNFSNTNFIIMTYFDDIFLATKIKTKTAELQFSINLKQINKEYYKNTIFRCYLFSSSNI